MGARCCGSRASDKPLVARTRQQHSQRPAPALASLLVHAHSRGSLVDEESPAHCWVHIHRAAAPCRWQNETADTPRQPYLQRQCARLQANRKGVWRSPSPSFILDFLEGIPKGSPLGSTIPVGLVHSGAATSFYTAVRCTTRHSSEPVTRATRCRTSHRLSPFSPTPPF